MKKKYIWLGIIAFVVLLATYRIYFPDPELRKSELEKETAKNNKIIGTWYLSATNALLPATYRLQTEGSAVLLKVTFEDNSVGFEPVELSQKDGQTKITYKDKSSSNNEYFIIEKDGNLGLYNSEDKRFGLAKKAL